MARTINLIGHKYGRLTVLSFEKTGNGYQRYWLCKCDCGNSHIVTGGALRSGNTISCGCYAREETSKRRVKHGESAKKSKYHSLYSVWCGMKRRCYLPSVRQYHRYGGRGISIDIEWINSFAIFKEWCLKNGWEAGLQIDRIDNDGNYCPANCRFVTAKINVNNRSNSIHIKFKGQSMSLQDWSKKIGIKERTLYSRLFEKHYPLDKAMCSSLYKTNGIDIIEV